MALHPTQGLRTRPIGKFRVAPLKSGDRVRIRVVTDCRPDGQYKGIPSYSIHRVDNPNPERQFQVEVPCLEGRHPGMCGRIVLPNGKGILHHAEPKDRPAVVVWNYAKNTLEIVDLSWGMFATLTECAAAPEWGNPRRYDFMLCARPRPGHINQTERYLTPVPPEGEFSPELMARIEQVLPGYDAQIEPDVTPEEVAAFLNGKVGPEGVGASFVQPIGTVPGAGGIQFPPAIAPAPQLQPAPAPQILQPAPGATVPGIAAAPATTIPLPPGGAMPSPVAGTPHPTSVVPEGWEDQ